MKFRLSLWPPVLEIETPDPEQVSTIDLVTAVVGVMQQNMIQPIVLVPEEDTED
ncbi:hypothetical protein [Nocardia asiatica]|uniref:hypothetical protein n=1 Tax=Nocardia asiatica TaxID=209252 RepID=UPI002457CD4E|nr:hypothetical protein [Nocardia asiatica]